MYLEMCAVNARLFTVFYLQAVNVIHYVMLHNAHPLCLEGGLA